jgi:hypothetical protein
MKAMQHYMTLEHVWNALFRIVTELRSPGLFHNHLFQSFSLIFVSFVWRRLQLHSPGEYPSFLQPCCLTFQEQSVPANCDPQGNENGILPGQAFSSFVFVTYVFVVLVLILTLAVAVGLPDPTPQTNILDFS